MKFTGITLVLCLLISVVQAQVWTENTTTFQIQQQPSGVFPALFDTVDRKIVIIGSGYRIVGPDHPYKGTAKLYNLNEGDTLHWDKFTVFRWSMPLGNPFNGAPGASGWGHFEVTEPYYMPENAPFCFAFLPYAYDSDWNFSGAMQIDSFGIVGDEYTLADAVGFQVDARIKGFPMRFTEMPEGRKLWFEISAPGSSGSCRSSSGFVTDTTWSDANAYCTENFLAGITPALYLKDLYDKGGQTGARGYSLFEDMGVSFDEFFLIDEPCLYEFDPDSVTWTKFDCLVEETVLELELKPTLKRKSMIQTLSGRLLRYEDAEPGMYIYNRQLIIKN